MVFGFKRVSGFITGLVAGLALITGGIAAAQAPQPRVKPAPPAPLYVSRSDEAVLEAYFDALDDEHFSVARNYLAQVNDPVARNVAEWAWFREQPDDVDWQAAGRFLDRNPDWPSEREIQRHAEESIPRNAQPGDVIAFFSQRKPVSGDGKLAFARALGEFGATITFVGNIPGVTQTVPSAIYTYTQVPGGELAALRLTIISVIIAFAALLVSEWLARRARRRTAAP